MLQAIQLFTTKRSLLDLKRYRRLSETDKCSLRSPPFDGRSQQRTNPIVLVGRTSSTGPPNRGSQWSIMCREELHKPRWVKRSSPERRDGAAAYLQRRQAILCTPLSHVTARMIFVYNVRHAQRLGGLSPWAREVFFFVGGEVSREGADGGGGEGVESWGRPGSTGPSAHHR